MFDSISNFVSAYSHVLAAIVFTLLAIASLSQQRIRFWVRDFWATFPVIGNIARLSKDTTSGNNGWTRSEEKLCAIYKPYVVLMTEKTFNQRIEYLRKAADLGRRPTPFFVWALLVVLVIAEGLGFSYLLGSWMAREGSANTHTLLMFAIVLVLCVIMVALTHFAGHQYYRTSLLRSCFKRYKDLGTAEYASKLVALSHEQDTDNNEPEHKQIVNRVAKHSHDRGSYSGGIIAIITIIFIATGSTYMRVKNLESELIREATTEEAPASNPFASTALPTEVAEAQHNADAKAREDGKAATTGEGMAAFAMLGFIFVITQIVGMGAGYKYGFSGRESISAFRALGGFSSYEDYWSYFQPLRDLGNARLKDLQQRMEEYSHTKLHLTKTFDAFLKEASTASQSLRESVNSIAAVQGKPAPSAVSEATSEIDRVKAEVARINDPDKEKEFVMTLSDELLSNSELISWLKERKAGRAQAAKAAVLDGLF